MWFKVYFVRKLLLIQLNNLTCRFSLHKLSKVVWIVHCDSFKLSNYTRLSAVQLALNLYYNKKKGFEAKNKRYKIASRTLLLMRQIVAQHGVISIATKVNRYLSTHSFFLWTQVVCTTARLQINDFFCYSSITPSHSKAVSARFAL